jgi:hypothetical protein
MPQKRPVNKSIQTLESSLRHADDAGFFWRVPTRCIHARSEHVVCHLLIVANHKLEHVKSTALSGTAS